MAVDLDRPGTRKKYDPSGMLDVAESMTRQFREGEALARAWKLPSVKGVRHVVISGMGGSAIGGDLLRAYAGSLAPVSVRVVRHYALPAYVGPATLMIAASYSGNTEETLSAYRDARRRSAQIVAVTTGGRLAQWCEKDGTPWLKIPSGYAPRAAIGYSFMPLLVSFARWGWIPDPSKAIKDLYRILDQSIEQNRGSVPLESNPAKQLASRLHGHWPVIYAGEDVMTPVAMRWRCQINENAKQMAHDLAVPEMNHNEILGWKAPRALIQKAHVIYLLDQGYPRQTQKRFAIMKTIFREAGVGVSEVHSSGQTLLARIFSLLNLGDFVSLYLAFLNRQDPSPIPAIDYLKTELAKSR